MTIREEHLKWLKAGLCVKCGGLKLKPEYTMCEKCRSIARKARVESKQTFKAPKIKVYPEIRKDHKCWNCVWSKFEGDRFFCPFMEGLCVKEVNTSEDNECNEVNEE